MVLQTDIAGEFKEQLQILIPYVLNPSKLMEKEINGSKVTCRGLLEYFKVHVVFLLLLLKCLILAKTGVCVQLIMVDLGVSFPGLWGLLGEECSETQVSFQE